MAASPLVAYTTPRLHTGGDRYRWLSRAQVVGKGVVDDDLGGIDDASSELR